MLGKVFFFKVTAAEVRLTVYYETPGSQPCNDLRNIRVVRWSARQYWNPLFDLMSGDQLQVIVHGTVVTAVASFSWTSLAGRYTRSGAFNLWVSIDLNRVRIASCGSDGRLPSGHTFERHRDA